MSTRTRHAGRAERPASGTIKARPRDHEAIKRRALEFGADLQDMIGAGQILIEEADRDVVIDALRRAKFPDPAAA